MRYLKVLFCLLLGFMLSTATVKAEKKDKSKVYAVGVSISFKSPTIFYTDVQELEGGVIEKGFLKGRDRYSYQFKGFLEVDKEAPNQTCAIYFSNDKGKLEKRISSLLRKYKKESSYSVVPVSSNEFTFTNPFISEGE
ncbi:MAG: hypothetical protein GX963_08930 [Bacteroidales bacterium]|nr:hypothetical protein [Bacteroidales bacterium]